VINGISVASEVLERNELSARSLCGAKQSGLKCWTILDGVDDAFWLYCKDARVSGGGGFKGLDLIRLSVHDANA
jgi:hypothetical protein